MPTLFVRCTFPHSHIIFTLSPYYRYRWNIDRLLWFMCLQSPIRAGMVSQRERTWCFDTNRREIKSMTAGDGAIHQLNCCLYIVASHINFVSTLESKPVTFWSIHWIFQSLHVHFPPLSSPHTHTHSVAKYLNNITFQTLVIPSHTRAHSHTHIHILNRFIYCSFQCPIYSVYQLKSFPYKIFRWHMFCSRISTIRKYFDYAHCSCLFFAYSETKNVFSHVWNCCHALLERTQLSIESRAKKSSSENKCRGRPCLW